MKKIIFVISLIVCSSVYAQTKVHMGDWQASGKIESLTELGLKETANTGTPATDFMVIRARNGILYAENDEGTEYDLTASSGIDGTGTTNELAYWVDSDTVGALAVATYPSLAELAHGKGVTSAIQTQLNAKAPSTAPTFATSITGSFLTASEILITDGSKNIVSAAVATYPSLTELTYAKGVTSAIQTQLGLKAPLASPTFTGNVTMPGTGIWNSSGNVGMGTTGPTNKLGVSGGIQLISATTNLYPTTGTGLEILYDGTANDFGAILSYNRTGAAYKRLNIDGSTLILNGNSGGNVGIGQTTPTAVLHLKAGTTAASTAPLKLTSGSLLTTAEAGAIEFLTDIFYGTISTGAARKQFYIQDGTDVAIADGGTGAGDAATAFTNLKQAATSSATGVVELLTTDEINTATDSTRAIPIDQFEASNYGKRTVSVLVNDSTALTTGDGKAYFRIPDHLAGWSMTDIEGARVAGTGTDTYMIYNVTQGTDTLSVALTIDANETDSSTAATPETINTAEDDATLGDRYRIDVDGTGTDTTWAEVQVTFERVP